MPLKGEVGGGALNSHVNCIADHGKSWKNHGIVFLNFCGNPEIIPDQTRLVWEHVKSWHILTIFQRHPKDQYICLKGSERLSRSVTMERDGGGSL